MFLIIFASKSEYVMKHTNNGKKTWDKIIFRRDIEDDLLAWKSREGHRPLIIEGARQIGKTWIMKHFGATQYATSAYFNFESSKELCEEFKHTKDPERLIPLFELYSGVKIIPGETLIILDEIQECPEALNSLKYFAEQAFQYDIIAAGSLLGVSLAGGGFPVGKVEFIKMYPVTFREYLDVSDQALSEYVDRLTEPSRLPEIVYNKLKEHCREYLICGGMPRVLLAWIESRDMDKVDDEIRNLVRAYELDFSKHAPKNLVAKIFDIWRSIPSQLARENRKFVYKLVRTGARAREYEDALMWMQQAGIIYRIFDCEKPCLPISAYEDVSAFKVYVFDIGLLRIMSNLDRSVVISDNPMYKEFKGAFMENYVLQSLMPQLKRKPSYWTSEGKAEVDFLIQKNDNIIPVEVKATDNIASKSLGVYIKKYSPEKALIVSSRNISTKDTVLEIPHSLCDWISNII